MNNRSVYPPAFLERALNSAIVEADISGGYEEYLEIFDRFYADEVEVSSETSAGPIVGKDRIRIFLLSFLMPLHVMAETGGVSVSLQVSRIPADSREEQHSEWSLTLLTKTGKSLQITWNVTRKWKDSRVVHEHQHQSRQYGEPLSGSDLIFQLGETDGMSNDKPH